MAAYGSVTNYHKKQCKTEAYSFKVLQTLIKSKHSFSVLIRVLPGYTPPREETSIPRLLLPGATFMWQDGTTPNLCLPLFSGFHITSQFTSAFFLILNVVHML